MDCHGLKDILKIGAAGLAGLFSGSAMYINLADHPARMMLNTPECRRHWAEAFRRAKVFQAGMCMAGSAAGVAVYYLDKDSDQRLLWLIGSGVFSLVLPYTKLVMITDIKKNLDEDIMRTEGETWVRDHIVRWNKQHSVRTVLAMTAFGVFLYALSKH